MKTRLLYFSPTGTTRTILAEVAKGMACCDPEHIDLTRMERGIELALADGVAVIGVPVYAGRVPELFLHRISDVTAAGVPTILVALYGNREFEDALVELRDAAISKGFAVVAAAAFVGEHSYSTAEQPIAAGRPDAADLSKAREFGALAAAKIAAGNLSPAPAIPGDFPYKERVPLGGIAPDTEQVLCTLCGACAEACPTFAVAVGRSVVTVARDCIKCCACTRVCPAGARSLTHPMVAARRDMLIENCSSRKEPSIFIWPRPSTGQTGPGDIPPKSA